MSDVRKFVVNTLGKPRLNIGGRDLRNNQVLSFKDEVVSNTPWIQIAIRKGNLEEVGATKTVAKAKPVSEEKSSPKPKKASSKKSEDKKVEEEVVEEVTSPSIEPEVDNTEEKSESADKAE